MRRTKEITPPTAEELTTQANELDTALTEFTGRSNIGRESDDEQPVNTLVFYDVDVRA